MGEMPKRNFVQKRRTCHGCGLESADDCPDKHAPALDTLYPCSTCVRNPQMKDHWNECWILDENGKPFIER